MLLSSTPVPSESPIQLGVSGSSGIPELIGLVFILILILVAAYYTTKIVGRFSIGQLKDSNFKVIDTYRINPNKFLQIVKVANKYVVISVSKDTVNFITELEESEVFVKNSTIKENMSFKQILEKVRNKTQ
jgi:flagellar protein FliO/FliZ